MRAEFNTIRDMSVPLRAVYRIHCAIQCKDRSWTVKRAWMSAAGGIIALRGLFNVVV